MNTESSRRPEDSGPSDSRLQQLCLAYGAERAHLEAAGQTAAASGPGGGLVAAVERSGLRPALGALVDGDLIPEVVARFFRYGEAVDAELPDVRPTGPADDVADAE